MIEHIPEWPIILVVISTLCTTWFLLGYTIACTRTSKRDERIENLSKNLVAIITERLYTNGEKNNK